jgi:predicted RNase H-like HicB family nuclease
MVAVFYMEYKIVLEPDLEDGGYVVHCPTLPGCYSQGDTRDEALDNIREAIEAYLESLKIDNLPIPRAVEPEIVSVRVRA